MFRHFCVYDGMMMNLAGGIAMFCIGIYLEIVMPKQYGKRYHPLFFLGCPWRKDSLKKLL